MEKYNLLFSSLSPSFTLNVLTYPLILGIIKTNGVITLYKHPIKYLGLVFVSTNFEITIVSKLSNKPFFCYFCLTKSQHYYTIKKNCDYFLAN